jgi:hypothetical protein
LSRRSATMLTTLDWKGGGMALRSRSSPSAWRPSLLLVLPALGAGQRLCAHYARINNKNGGEGLSRAGRAPDRARRARACQAADLVA